MATNQHSCAVTFSMLLSIAQTAFFVYLAYHALAVHSQVTPAEWIQKLLKEGTKQSTTVNKDENSSKVGKERQLCSYDLEVTLIILSIVIEFILISKNYGLKQTYWEQELLAIKQAYQASAGGIRSKRMKSNAQDASYILSGHCGLSKKQEKQMILRKLQYDLVKDYAMWYAGLFAFKIILGVTCLLGQYSLGQLEMKRDDKAVVGALGQQATTQITFDSIIKAFIEQISSSSDPTHIVPIMVAARMFEAINFLFIFRWLTNIKIDIMRFIRLLKKKRLAAAQSLTPGNTPGCTSSGAEDIDGDLGDHDDMKDFARFDQATYLAVQRATGNGVSKKSAELLAESIQIYLNNYQDFDPNNRPTLGGCSMAESAGTFEPLDESMALQSELGADLDNEFGPLLGRHSSAPSQYYMDFRSGKSAKSRGAMDNKSTNSCSRMSMSSSHTNVLQKATIVL